MALTVGVLALVEAKPGKEDEVEAFLREWPLDCRAGARYRRLVRVSGQ